VQPSHTGISIKAADVQSSKLPKKVITLTTSVYQNKISSSPSESLHATIIPYKVVSETDDPIQTGGYLAPPIATGPIGSSSSNSASYSDSVNTQRAQLSQSVVVQTTTMIVPQNAGSINSGSSSSYLQFTSAISSFQSSSPAV
jgi:hypothetical protein